MEPLPQFGATEPLADVTLLPVLWCAVFNMLELHSLRACNLAAKWVSRISAQSVRRRIVQAWQGRSGLPHASMAACHAFVAGRISPEEFAGLLLRRPRQQGGAKGTLSLLPPKDSDHQEGAHQQPPQFFSSERSAEIVGAFRLPGAATVFTSVLGLSDSCEADVELLLDTASTCLFRLSEELDAAIFGKACRGGLPVGLKALFSSGLHTALFRCAAWEEVGEASDLIDALHCVFFVNAQRFTAHIDATQPPWVKTARDCIAAAKELAQQQLDNVVHWSAMMEAVNASHDFSKPNAPTWVLAFYLHGILAAKQDMSNRANIVDAEATALLDLLVILSCNAKRRCLKHGELLHVRGVVAGGLERLRACEVARRRWNACPGYCESRLSA